jgi:hypothetical protein
MSSSNYGCSADTIKIDFLKEQCPDEYAELLLAMANADVCLSDFFIAKHFEDDFECDDTDAELIESFYEVLQKAFEEKTGLELGTVYHDAEERSDELDGGAFTVDGVYGYTVAGEKFKDKIEKLNWTTFG